MRKAVSVSLGLLLAAFDSGCQTDPQGSTSSTGNAPGLAAPPEDRGLQLRQAFGPMAPNTEVHDCQLYTLPNRAVDVQRFAHAYTPGGHHVILYPTALTPEQAQQHPGVFDCDAVMPDRASLGFSYVGGGTTGSQAYPTGTAWHFEPNQVVMLESHMLNTGSAPLDVEYRVNLEYATEPVKDHVGTIFFYDNNIVLPASGQATARMHCAVPADIHVVALTPHMHVRGTAFRTQLVGGALTSPLALPGSDDWASAEATVYDPPLDMTAGQAVDFHCDYVNPDPHVVVSGGSKTQNEMCLLIGSYYPKLDFPFEFCMRPGSGPVYDGSTTCADSFACFAATGDPAGIAAQQCATATCAGSGQAFDDFYSCSALDCALAGKCAATADGGSDCRACTLASCKAQVEACQNAGCP